MELKHGNNLCLLQNCPVVVTTTEDPVNNPLDGGYGPWSEWSACSASCQIPGIPVIRRAVRECNNPEPANGGKACVNAGLGEADKQETCTGLEVSVLFHCVSAHSSLRSLFNLYKLIFYRMMILCLQTNLSL